MKAKLPNIECYNYQEKPVVKYFSKYSANLQ